MIFLQSCASIEQKSVITKPPQSIPNAWQTSGRLGVEFSNKSQNAGFEARFDGSNYQLILTTALGLGRLEIAFKNGRLQVDSEPISKSFKAWMLGKIHWYFPIYELGKIAFNRPFESSEWRLQIISRQTNGLPKIIRLIHRSKNIKIKLIFQNISLI
ncbi:MAG: hypothetical protein HAW58_01065 [Candidatus Thioglobus sp.]|nr:hypothetical protein [Candidatus Thioglobus sp.]